VSELLDTAVAVAERAAPGEALEAYVALGTDTQIRAYEGNIEHLRSATTAGIGIRVVLGGTGHGVPGGALDGPGAAETEGNRVGFAWAGSLEADVVDAVLAEARDNAAYATPDREVTLAVPDGVPLAELDLFRPGFTTAPIERKIELALELERLARAADPRVRTVRAADYGDASTETAIASSTGVRVASRRTSAYLSVATVAGEGSASRTASGLSIGRAPDDLDPAQAATEAAARAVRLLGAGKVASERRTVVFDPRVVSTLLAVLASALSGEAVVKGRSFFAGRVGEAVGTAELTLVDDPTDARAFRAAVHDAEGLACRRNVFLDAGVLRGYAHDTVSARRAGVAPTGSAVRGGFSGTPHPGCRALVLAPGPLGQTGILESVGDALYVQSVTGVHSGVNPVSGDFSVGADGLLVRTGAFAEPVREVTVASTLQRMLRSVLHVGADLEWLPGLAAGQTLAVADMQVSGS
jgi:PmbA protein